MAASCVGPTGNLNTKAKRTLFHTYSTVLSGHADYSSFYSPKSIQFRANLRAIPREPLRAGDHVSARRHSFPFTCLLGLRTRQLTLQTSFARLPTRGPKAELLRRPGQGNRLLPTSFCLSPTFTTDALTAQGVIQFGTCLPPTVSAAVIT